MTMEFRICLAAMLGFLMGLNIYQAVALIRLQKQVRAILSLLNREQPPDDGGI